jgi:glycosyltransferase involved in cell wall biosynthesis
MAAPTVSIVIPTFNRAPLLPRAIESVQAQTFDDWEIVLVDDGSTDDTEALAGDYAVRLGDRFHYSRQANAGSSAARNRGIDAARGRFVAFLDSDDEYLPRKLERQLDLFARCPELGFVYSDYSFVDRNGVRHESVFDESGMLARQVPHETVAPDLCVCTGRLFDTLIRGYFIATITGMVRREVLGQSIRFPEDQAYAEEWLFYLRVAQVCEAGFVDEPLCLHHHVAGSLARTDRRRNARRYRDLLRAMRRALPDLSWSHRRTIADNLATACRQVGCDAFADRQYGRAVRAFAEAFASRPSLQTLYDVLHSSARLVRSGFAGAPSFPKERGGTQRQFH